jgi:hypothetical protein
MAGLLGGVLPAIYSGADQVKRQIYGLLTNPSEMAQRAGQNLLQSRAERQALMAQTFANPDRPFQVTDQAGLAQLGTDVLTGELGIAPIGMIAYHGTPHNILGKFDINRVGTGEGNQTFGYGMYFAENPAVAKQYQASLSETKYFADGKQLKGNDAWAAQFLHDFQDDALPKKVDVNTAVAKANEILKSGEAREEIVNKIKQLDKTGVSVESGNLYKVDIPDEYVPKMLDWDKPIKEQPKYIKDKLAELGISSEMTGKQAYNFTKEILKMDMAGTPTPADVSAFLNSKGISGIRYLDEGSRDLSQKYVVNWKGFGGYDFPTLKEAQDFMKQHKGEDLELIKPKPQTSNFVVFDPTDVKILERNNQPFEGLLGN